MAAHPNVGSALAAGRLRHAPFECILGANGIGFRGRRLPEKGAQVEEMLLVSAALGEMGTLPLGDEFLRGHLRHHGGAGGGNSTILTAAPAVVH
jgi:hypothetical protein